MPEDIAHALVKTRAKSVFISDSVVCAAGEVEKARFAFRKALALEPADVRAVNGLAALESAE